MSAYVTAARVLLAVFLIATTVERCFAQAARAPQTPSEAISKAVSDPDKVVGSVADPGLLEDDQARQIPNTDADAASETSVDRRLEDPNVDPMELDDRPILSAESSARATGVSAQPQRLDTLQLGSVIASVYRSFPVIVQARQQTQVANGQLTEAWGNFDTKLKMESLNEPTGFYENYRHAIGASQQTWNGGNVYGGYRIGRGDFQPWYKERETDKGGEFKFGYRQALMQGRAIDPARVAVYQATLDQKAVGPEVANVILQVSLDASLNYWDWVEAGLKLQAQQKLLGLAVERGGQIDKGFKAGRFKEIDLILNKQLIAERRATLIEAQQKFQQSGFKLSLFLRDKQGNPLIPDESLLPNLFPDVFAVAMPDIGVQLANALTRRPEMQLLDIERKRLRYHLALAINQTQPMLDFISEASQDMGQDASSSNDKDQLLVILGIQGEVPIQRRKARGKAIALRAKLQQLEQKQRFLSNKIQADLAIGFNEIQRDAEVVEQARLSLEIAQETLERFRVGFDKGKIDLIYLNLLEVKTNETEIKLLTAQRQWHAALARLLATLGIDPLEPEDAVSGAITRTGYQPR